MTIDKDKVNDRNKSDQQIELGDQNDKLVTRQLKNIVQLLSYDEISHPDITIDKSIIAAAHRNAILPRIERSYQISWWRKISLPLYISAGFVFTVLAYKNLWPEHLELIQGETNSIIAHELLLEIDHSSHSSVATEQGMKTSTKLPELAETPKMPNRTEGELFQPQTEAIQPNINLSAEAVDKITPQVFTGNQLVKAKYREKESWAREIIEQMRAGQFEQASSQLRDFKEIYPSYPIDEQIKVLTQ